MSKESRGRHRRARQRAAVTTTIPVALALAAASVAQAAPAQQPGVTSPSSPSQQPGVTLPAQPEKPRQYLPGYTPSPEVQNAQWRTYDDFQQGYIAPQTVQPQAVAPEPVYTDPGYTQPQSYSQEYSEGWSEPQTAAPVEVEPAVVESAPVPVETVEVKRIAPIEAPEGKILIGHALFDRPGFISEDDAERFNNTAAALQADGGNLLTDLGVDASQADRATAGAIAGGATGAVIGASVAGIPPALLGAAVGAGTGGLIGWTIGGAGATPASYVLAPQGAAIGAGVGAAVAGIPTALIGGAVGGAIGAGIGATAFGGQEVVEQQEVAPAPVVEGEVLADAPEAAPAPAPEPLPVISPEDAVLVKAQTQQTIDQIAGLPGGDLAVDAARNAALAAPQALEGLRGSIVAIGGEGVVVAVESAATAVAQATAPVGPNGELALETLTA